MAIAQADAGLAQTFIARRSQLHEAAEKILGCRQRAEDVVQEAFMKVSEHAEPQNVQQPTAYLFRTVRNLAIDQYRRSAFETRYFTAEESGWDVPAPQQTPEAMLFGSQVLGIIVQALAELPERTRKALDLHRVEGLTQREVAKHLGVSTTLVNFIIRDAVAHCRNALERVD